MNLSTILNLRSIALICLCLLLSACEGEIDTNEDAPGSTPSPEQQNLNNNDSFLNAYRVSNLPFTLNDSLSTTDTVDYFVVQLQANHYRQYSFALRNLTGDADIELINAYLNRESWSDNEGTDDELIEYWRDYFDPDDNIVFLKISNRSDSEISYTMEIN